jgi:anti-sigma B factor antagonist
MPTALRRPSEKNPIKFAISELSPDDATTVIAVAGELDLASAPRFKHSLIRAAREHEKGLVVDFSELTFIDSTAIRILVDARALRPVDDPFVVVCAHPRVLTIFKIAGLEGTLQLAPSMSEALDRVHAGGVKRP